MYRFLGRLDLSENALKIVRFRRYKILWSYFATERIGVEVMIPGQSSNVRFNLSRR
jgi:hypothetical protein